MKAIVLLTLLSLGVAAQSSKRSINPIKELRNEALQLVKSFQLTDLGIDGGAPEYPAIKAEFMEAIKTESKNLDETLIMINGKLSMDYSIIRSLKRKKRDRAMKSTIKVATQRLISNASTVHPDYINALKSLITLETYQRKLLKKCLSVLCVNKLEEDFNYWFRKARRLNKDLDLEVTELRKISKFSKKMKAICESLEGIALNLESGLPVFITDPQYKKHVEDLKEKARIKREKEEARLAEEKANDKDKFGCENVKKLKGELIFACEKPFKVISGANVLLSAKNYKPELHQSICGSLGLGMPASDDFWFYHNSKNYQTSDFTIHNVICVSDTYKRLDRLNYSRAITLDDGSIIYEYPSFEFNFGKLNFYEGIASELCQYLGHNESVGQQSNWTRYEKNVVRISNNKLAKESSKYYLTKIVCK